MAWKKGESGNPTGRPEGAKNKNYLDPNFWTEKLYEVYENTPDDKKAEMAFRMITMLFSKIPVIPLTPMDSVNNAKAIIETLEQPVDTHA